MRSTFRILFLLRTRLNKDGSATLMIRVTLDTERIEISSKMSLNPADWDAKSGKVKGRSKSALEINNTIAFMHTRLNNLYQQILESNGYVTADKLRASFLGLEEKQHTLLNLFDKKIAQKKALAGISIQEAVVDKYTCTKKKVSEFIQSYYKREDLLIKEVAYDFISNFDIFLRSKYKCGDNTVVRHMRYLKQITTDALKCRYIQFDPFYDFTLSSKKGKREYLSEEELLRIMNKSFDSKILEEVRDVFIFCCFSGLAYVDVSKLRKQDIIEKANGEQFIIKDRTKSGVQCYVPLLDVPQIILQKYANRTFPSNKILPICACQNMNIYIKEIAALCGINKSLSTHCGRHTFATVMLTKGVSIESVSKMLGHTDIKTTQIYAKILNQKVDREVDLVRADLNKMANCYVDYEILQ